MVTRYEPQYVPDRPNPFGRQGGHRFGGTYKHEQGIEISERQLALAKYWGTRRLTDAALRARAVSINARDRQEYQDRSTADGVLMKKGENNLCAEFMLFEGADGSRGYEWLGDLAVVYPPNPVDDWLRGCDAIVFLTDPDNESRAFSLSIDVKTTPEQAEKGLDLKMMIMTRSGDQRDGVYWADSSVDPDGSSFEEMHPGKIFPLQCVVYIPSDMVGRYRSEKTSETDAKSIMADFGPVARKQLQIQLEFMALIRLGIRPADLARKGKEAWSRKRLHHDLESVRRSKRPDQVLFDIANVLNQIWEIQEDEESYGRLPANMPNRLKTWERNIREFLGET